MKEEAVPLLLPSSLTHRLTSALFFSCGIADRNLLRSKLQPRLCDTKVRKNQCDCERDRLIAFHGHVLCALPPALRRAVAMVASVSMDDP